MIKVAITGSTGLVGSRIVELLGGQFSFIPLRQNDMNITDKDQVWNTLKSLDYDIFFHLAAYTNVDGAENEQKSAFDINVTGTKHIFDSVMQQKKKMIYISTDFVFDGMNPPYTEFSIPHPISTYGKSKYEGEQVVKDNAMIIRISYPYRKSFSAKRDFVATIKMLLAQKKTISMVNDSLMTLTFIDDIAYACGHLIQQYVPETFHIVGADALSPFDAGQAIAKVFNFPVDFIKPVSYDEYFKGKALRPKLSDMKSRKNDFYRMKPFVEGLQFILNSK